MGSRRSWLTAAIAMTGFALTGTGDVGKLAIGPAPACECEPASEPATATEFDPSAPAGPLIGVATSRVDRDTIAAWSESRLAISGDRGRQFTAVEVPLPIHSVAIDRAGAVYALSDHTITELTAGGSESIRLSIDGSADRLIAAGDRLVLAGVGALWISTDRGRSWEAREAPEGNAANALFADASGALQLLVGNEASCGGGFQQRYTSRVGAGEWAAAPWPFDIPVGAFVGPGGWAYGYEQGCQGTDGLCAIRGGEPVLVRAIADYPSDERWATNGTVTIAAIDRLLLRIDGGEASDLGEVPANLSALAVDPDGEPLAVANGTLVRREAGAWRVVFPDPAALSMAAR